MNALKFCREPASSSVSEAIAKVFAHLSTNPHYLYSQVRLEEMIERNHDIKEWRRFQKLVNSSHLDIKDSLIINRLYRFLYTAHICSFSSKFHVLCNIVVIGPTRVKL